MQILLEDYSVIAFVAFIGFVAFIEGAQSAKRIAHGVTATTQGA